MDKSHLNSKKNIHQDLIKNLSDEEQKYLKKLNDLSNQTRNDIKKNNDFLQLSIYNIINEWSKNMRHILEEIVNLQFNNESDNWWKDILDFINKLINIISKDDRKIYVGLTLVIIAFLLFIIEATS
jgi:hypothetical protein